MPTFPSDPLITNLSVEEALTLELNLKILSVVSLPFIYIDHPYCEFTSNEYIALLADEPAILVHIDAVLLAALLGL